jgi:hypothetical protein
MGYPRERSRFGKPTAGERKKGKTGSGQDGTVMTHDVHPDGDGQELRDLEAARALTPVMSRRVV